MKVLLFGKDTKNIEGSVKKLGLEIVQSNPDVVISYGGDGTLLSSEREYPGIPKLPIRNSQFCHKCADHADGHLLGQLPENKLQLKEYKKLHTNIAGSNLYALNDFVVRNELPIHAIRFKVTSPVTEYGVNSASHPFGSEPQGRRPERPKGVEGSLLIGDGIVISTPFGSSGYFKSVSGQKFKEGFGVAFNNTTEKMDPLLLQDQDSVTFQLIRGKAILSFDNSPDIFNIVEGSKLVFNLSDQVAKIYADTSLRCPNCKVYPQTHTGHGLRRHTRI